MKCMSCEMEINPQWKHAIDMNNCPFCGQLIMPGPLKDLFTTLRETMDALKDYPSQLNDWMLSNHNYIKTDSSDLIKHVPKELLTIKKETAEKSEKDNTFIVKVKNEAGEEEEVVAKKIQTEEKTNEFFKRAQATNPNQSPTDKNQHFKSLVQQIKRGGAPVINESGVGSVISPEMMEHADPEAVADYNSILSGGDAVSSSNQDSNDGDEIPSVVLSMASRASGKGGGGQNAADMAKLQEMHHRVDQAKANFESGANRGKNGFSRSS